MMQGVERYTQIKVIIITIISVTQIKIIIIIIIT